MKNKYYVLFVLTVSAIFTISISVSYTEAQPAGAFKVESVDRAAWLINPSESGSVKSSLKPGNILYQDDMVEVFSGNRVALSFVGEPDNKLELQGPCTIRITNNETKELETLEGKVFAFIDRLEPGQTFNITSLTAVASVRGTHFLVHVSGPNTSIFTYEGSVQTYAKSPKGEVSEKFSIVSGGQKTVYDGYQKTIPEVQDMTSMEESEIVPVLIRMNKSFSAQGDEESAGPSQKRAGSSQDGRAIEQPTEFDDFLVESYYDE